MPLKIFSAVLDRCLIETAYSVHVKDGIKNIGVQEHGSTDGKVFARRGLRYGHKC